MAFHALMIRLVAEVLPLLPASPSVIELGHQTFKPRPGIVAEIERFLSAQGRAYDRAALDRLASGPGDGTRVYMAAIGYGRYDCIDVNDRRGALPMDLNVDLAAHYGFTDRYDLVTNNGTGEHVFDQAAVFRNVHALARPAGLMLHVLPFYNYVNHGFFNYQPGLFADLAGANGYELLRLSLATSGGAEIGLADGPLGPTTRAVERVSRQHGLARTAIRPTLGAMVRQLGGRNRSPLARAIQRLAAQKANVSVVALMRKSGQDAFRSPLQGLYAGANVGSPEIAARYPR